MLINVKFQPEVFAAIRDEADRLGVSMAAVVRASVCGTLKIPNDPPIRTARRLSALESERIGATAERLIRDGFSNAEVLAGIRAAHGPSASSPASVAWYRNKLRRRGDNVPTNTQVRRAKSSDDLSV